MNSILKKINLKKLLKSWGITNSDFSFDIEYQNGYYCTFGDIGYEVAFGKKTKSKYIAYLEVTKPAGNFLLEELEVKARIGETLGSEKTELQMYDVKYKLDSNGCLLSVFIEDYEVIEKNSSRNKNIKLINDLVEPKGAIKIHKTLFGEWEYDKEFSYSLNSHKTERDEVDYQLTQGRPIYNFYDDNTAELFNLDYISDFGEKLYKLKTINSDGSFQVLFVEKAGQYKFLSKFIILEDRLVLVAGNRKDNYKSCYRKAWSRIAEKQTDRPRRKEYYVYMNGK
ncbi:MAG: hypothetical protein NE328_17945 [Lentisphaeraceae bacterium]|nr:hypothetical protein [Lentisphaeraceae bacterium]